jgi:hypothetical protein
MLNRHGKYEGEDNMSSYTLRAFLSGAAILAIGCVACAQSSAEEKNTPALAAAMKDARTTLEQGLGTADKTGRPISAKFEVEDGKLQLSIYVVGGDGFREVLLDPLSGASRSADKITDTDDLKDAEEQSAAMAKSKTALLAAVQHAIAADTGTRVISAYPGLQDGQPIAAITLLRGDDFNNVTEKLD